MAPNYRYYGRTKILLNLDSFGIQTGDETTLFRNLPFSPNDASHDSTGSILWEKLPQQIYTDVLKLNDTTILLIGPGFIVWQGIFIEKIDDLGNQIENSLYRINANVWGYAVDLDFENKLIIG